MRCWAQGQELGAGRVVLGQPRRGEGSCNQPRGHSGGSQWGPAVQADQTAVAGQPRWTPPGRCGTLALGQGQQQELGGGQGVGAQSGAGVLGAMGPPTPGAAAVPEGVQRLWEGAPGPGRHLSAPGEPQDPLGPTVKGLWSPAAVTGPGVRGPAQVWGKGPPRGAERRLEGGPWLGG